MMGRLCLAAAALYLIAAGPLPSDPKLGTVEGRCSAQERGTAFIVTAVGLKDRTGRLRLELYPDNDQDFLADDNVLISRGKVFRRVDIPVPAQGPAALCIRAPKPGFYTLSLLHDRNEDHKFTFSTDGIGFPNDPKLGWSRPKAAAARVAAQAGLTPLRIRLNYRRGLLAFGPIGG